MPLTLVQPGRSGQIKRVGGRPETRRFLENLGFVAGGQVSVISRSGGNLIVEIRGARVAVDSAMAARILV